jgi:hypothetical protein
MTEDRHLHPVKFFRGYNQIYMEKILPDPRGIPLSSGSTF